MSPSPKQIDDLQPFESAEIAVTRHLKELAEEGGRRHDTGGARETTQTEPI